MTGARGPADLPPVEALASEVPADPATAGAADGLPSTTAGLDEARRAPLPAGVVRAASWSWRVLLIAAASALVMWLIVQLKIVVVPVAVALLLTVLLTPLVHFFQRRLRMSRTVASMVSVILLLVLVIGLLTLAGRSIVVGISELWSQASEGIDQVMDWLATGPLKVSEDDVTTLLDRAREATSGASSEVVSGALAATVTLGHVLTGAVIAVFCTFFFLKDGRMIWAWVVGLMPRGTREHTHQAARRGIVTLGAYTRTQILVAAVDAIGIGVGAAILGVPLALPLAILVFIGSFVPIVGALVSGTVAVLVALVAQGPGVALVMLGIVLAVQQIEGHVLQPFLMGHAVSLHPVAVILVVTAGSFIAGILGALFAVPIAATINTVVLYLHGHDKFPQLGLDDHVAVRGRGHPVLDRAIAQVAESEAEIAATRQAMRLEETERAEGARPGGEVGDSPVTDEPDDERPDTAR